MIQREIDGSVVLAPAEPIVAEWAMAPHGSQHWLTAPRLRLAFVCTGFLTALLAAVEIPVMFHFHRPRDFVYFLVLAVIAQARPNLRRWLCFGESFVPLDHLADLPSGLAQLPVEISVVKAGHLMGKDEGFVSFADGWMTFQGRRTVFHLHKSNVSYRLPKPDSRGEPAILSYDADGYRFTLTVQPFDRTLGGPAGQWNAFANGLATWEQHESSWNGLPIYPPIRANPEFTGRLAPSYLAAFAGALVLLFVASGHFMLPVALTITWAAGMSLLMVIAWLINWTHRTRGT